VTSTASPLHPHPRATSPAEGMIRLIPPAGSPAAGNPDRSRAATSDRAGHGHSLARPGYRQPVRSWPLLILALPAAITVWSGWVGIGQLTGFDQVHPLPGIWNSLHLDTAITLPVGVEAYAAYALRAWLTTSGAVSARTRRFARTSAIASLALGMAGQVAYHLLAQAHAARAPAAITTAVSCLPVAVLGMGAALAHLLYTDTRAHRPGAHGPERGPDRPDHDDPGQAHAGTVPPGRLADAAAARLTATASTYPAAPCAARACAAPTPTSAPSPASSEPSTPRRPGRQAITAASHDQESGGNTLPDHGPAARDTRGNPASSPGCTSCCAVTAARGRPGQHPRPSGGSHRPHNPRPLRTVNTR
jgi:hypothetical protein